MDDQSSQSRSLFAWLRGLAKLCQRISGGVDGRKGPAINALDDKLKRDIGVETDGKMGVGEVRQAFYRKMLERGQPLL